MTSHEILSRADETRQGSDRNFGIVFCVVFALIGGFQLYHGIAWGWWTLAVAAAFLVVALLRPGWLAPLNRLWFRFGLLLHRVVNPLVMALFFISTILPVGLLMRLFGKRPLNLKFRPEAASYWIVRDPPGPAPDSFRNQF